MVIAITGATGFLGDALLRRLSSQYEVVALVRKEPLDKIAGVECRICGDLAPTQEWGNLLSRVDAVIHTAARVHVMHERFASDREYRRTNVEGTLNLARQAANAGVKRFIFLSSIKVNGEQTPVGQPFSADDTLAPEDAYGISKWEAEQGLQQLASETGMEVVIIRPPLVYGPGVKGNFASMINLVAKGLPLPLGAIHNQRSLVAVDNLVDLIITCIDHPAAVNQVFLAGDGQDLSTTQLLRGVARAMGKPSRLIPVPAFLLMLGATLLGKKAVAQRLLGSLQVDISKARILLGWEPPISLEEGLRRCFQSKDNL